MEEKGLAFLVMGSFQLVGFFPLIFCYVVDMWNFAILYFYVVVGKRNVLCIAKLFALLH